MDKLQFTSLNNNFKREHVWTPEQHKSGEEEKNVCRAYSKANRTQPGNN